MRNGNSSHLVQSKDRQKAKTAAEKYTHLDHTGALLSFEELLSTYKRASYPYGEIKISQCGCQSAIRWTLKPFHAPLLFQVIQILNEKLVRQSNSAWLGFIVCEKTRWVGELQAQSSHSNPWDTEVECTIHTGGSGQGAIPKQDCATYAHYAIWDSKIVTLRHSLKKCTSLTRAGLIEDGFHKKEQAYTTSIFCLITFNAKHAIQHHHVASFSAARSACGVEKLLVRWCHFVYRALINGWQPKGQQRRGRPAAFGDSHAPPCTSHMGLDRLYIISQLSFISLAGNPLITESM